MRGRGSPRSGLADCLMAIRISPTFVPVGPGVHEIFGSFERGAGIELAPRALDVAARDLRALDVPGIHDGARIVGRAVGAIGARGEHAPGFAGAQLPRDRQRQMRIAAAAPVTSPAASPSIPRPTRVHRLWSRAAPRRTARGHFVRIAVESLRARFERQAVRRAASTAAPTATSTFATMTRATRSSPVTRGLTTRNRSRPGRRRERRR